MATVDRSDEGRYDPEAGGSSPPPRFSFTTRRRRLAFLIAMVGLGFAIGVGLSIADGPPPEVHQLTIQCADQTIIVQSENQPHLTLPEECR